jgi:hypothetical protein
MRDQHQSEFFINALEEEKLTSIKYVNIDSVPWSKNSRDLQIGSIHNSLQ